MSLRIYYSELVQFKIAYPIANVKFFELKSVCVERLNRFSKLVKTNYGGIPDSFDEESYCLQDSTNAFLDDGDIVSDLVKENDTIKLVYLPNLLKTNQAPPTQQQQVQQVNPIALPAVQPIKPPTSVPTLNPTNQPQSYDKDWLSNLVINVKGASGLLQQQQPQNVVNANDQIKNEEELEQLKQQFYLDVSKLNDVQQLGDFSFQIYFIQAQDSKKKYDFKCDVNHTLYELSQIICKSLGLNEEHSICIYSQSGLPLYSCLNLMYTKTVEETLNKLINKIFGIIITKCNFGDKPLPKIDSNQGPQQIFVLHQGSKVINVDLQTTTVIELKQKVFHKFDIPTTLQMLVYGGKYLDDSKILSEYGIQANSNVYLTFKTTDVQPYQSSYNFNFYTPWLQHIVPQSPAGLRQFRCSSLVFFAHVKEPNILALLRKISNDNSSLILSISQLMRKLKQSQLHCIAFEIGMQILFFELMLSTKKILKTFKIDMIFEYSRYFYNWIKKQDSYKNDQILEIAKQENYRLLDLVSQITLKPILNPALLSQKPSDDEQMPQDWSLVDFDEIQNKIKNNEQHISKVLYSELKLVQPGWLLEEFRIVSFLNRETLIWAPKSMIDSNDYVLEVPPDWIQNIVASTHICTKIYGGTELKAHPESPCLTNGADKQLIIYVGPNKDVKKPINVYNPITGMEMPVNPDDLALLQFRGVNVAVDEEESESENEEQLKQPPQISQPPDEAIVVLFDISGSMDELFYESEDLTRMGVVKAFFNAFADRTMAYNLKNVISLVFFDDRYIQKCSFTELFILFKELVNKAKPQGSTLLYTALQKAQQSLLEFRKLYPNCILRIIALTDGEDNSKHGVAPILVAETIKKNNIILDSFVVNDQCSGLKKITKATGGQCFCPKTLQEGLKLFEYETILSAKIRKEKPKITLKFLRDTFKLRNDQIQFDDKPIDILLPNEMQQQSIHPNALVQEISSDQNKLNHYAPNNSLKRVIKEIMNYEQHPHPYVKIFPCQTNVSFWKIILLGPESTPYATGVYILFLKFNDDYPFKPPEFRFLTPIYHCNINSQGRICHSILGRNYTPDTTVLQIFEAIYGLLMTPEPDDPLDTTIASEYLQDLQVYQNKAKQHTEANAKKPLDEVIKQIVGNQDIKVVNDEELQSKIQEINNWINLQQQPHQ